MFNAPDLVTRSHHPLFAVKVSHFLVFSPQQNSKWNRKNHKEERIHRQILHLTDMLLRWLQVCTIDLLFWKALKTIQKWDWWKSLNRCGELKMTYLHFQFQRWKRVASDILWVSRRWCHLRNIETRRMLWRNFWSLTVSDERCNDVWSKTKNKVETTVGCRNGGMSIHILRREPNVVYVSYFYHFRNRVLGESQSTSLRRALFNWIHTPHLSSKCKFEIHITHRRSFALLWSSEISSQRLR